MTRGIVHALRDPGGMFLLSLLLLPLLLLLLLKVLLLLLPLNNVFGPTAAEPETSVVLPLVTVPEARCNSQRKHDHSIPNLRGHFTDTLLMDDPGCTTD